MKKRNFSNRREWVIVTGNPNIQKLRDMEKSFYLSHQGCHKDFLVLSSVVNVDCDLLVGNLVGNSHCMACLALVEPGMVSCHWDTHCNEGPTQEAELKHTTSSCCCFIICGLLGRVVFYKS